MSGTIISNTGPIIALAVIDKLDLLRRLFDQVFVPEAVHFELLEGGAHQPGRSAYQQATWIQPQKLQKQIDPLLTSVLDSGEASVIQLAGERAIDLVLIDERKGRKIAREIYNLRVIGTARVLVEAKHKGYLENVKDIVIAMRQQGYWLHDKLVELILQEANEK